MSQEQEPFTVDEKKLNQLFSSPCTFMRGVQKIEDLPEFGLFEIAFAGRSNVGKSSLINALMGRKALARTSNTPGRTQQLNFFNLAEKFILVDMPGYGYAKAPKELVSQWQVLIRQYCLGRPTLKRIFLLIDSRHGIKEKDAEMMNLLDKTAVSYQIVLTKKDKISDFDCHQIYKKTLEKIHLHAAAFPEIIFTSSEKNEGIHNLRVALYRILYPE